VLDHLAHLARESARFAEALEPVQADAPVPSCPAWRADDLLWHLAEVQWFWGTIVREHLADPSPINVMRPARPTDRAGLLSFYRKASHDLGEALASASPETPVWTWAEDHTVGFIRRRQAHEALIHRVDAELTAGDRTAMDPVLSADGVDEALRIMHGGAPAWAKFTPVSPASLRILTTDTGDSWTVRVGRLTGTDPEGGNAIDQGAVDVSEKDTGETAQAIVVGSAADLDCFLWCRPPAGHVEGSGDATLLRHLDSVIEPGIQ
jgi:uncharacterized protein (TIGR03083 family)